MSTGERVAVVLACLCAAAVERAYGYVAARWAGAACGALIGAGTMALIARGLWR